MLPAGRAGFPSFSRHSRLTFYHYLLPRIVLPCCLPSLSQRCHCNAWRMQTHHHHQSASTHRHIQTKCTKWEYIQIEGHHAGHVRRVPSLPVPVPVLPTSITATMSLPVTVSLERAPPPNTKHNHHGGGMGQGKNAKQAVVAGGRVGIM